MSENSIREEFEREAEKIRNEQLMTPAYKRRKLIGYGIRTVFAIVLYVALWRYEWFRWTLLFYIPLNLFGLAVILGYNRFANRRLDKLKQKIEEMEGEREEPEN